MRDDVGDEAVFEDEPYYICHDGKGTAPYPDRNKVMKINERWEELKEESHAPFRWKCHLGDIKQNEDFRRFNDRSSEKAYKEFMLYVISRNIMKYHRFLHQEIEK